MIVQCIYKNMRTCFLFLPWLASTAIGPITGFVASVTIALWNASAFSHQPRKVLRNAATQTIQEAESGFSKGESEAEENAKKKTEGAVLEGYVWTYNSYDHGANFTKFSADR